ncbi:glycosyltransferase 87 family protein [Lentzea sp.]|uniref:glycosyltransferase 87 family protein n=1 Tax=Lentzea sp. TaxID=56099 RepID=UPI002ED2D014
MRDPSSRGVVRWSALGATLVVCAFGLVTTALAFRAETIDLEVYRAGAAAVLAGAPLYETAVWQDMQFTYPPFAALLFAPLALLGSAVATGVVAAGNSALLVYVSSRCWRSAGTHTGSKLLVVSLVTASALLATETVHVTLYLGQINFVLLALVLGDLLRDDPKRTKGIGLGIAAGIKLTPLIFVLYLLLTRRFRAAAVATGTFAATIAAGFLLLPGDAARYWLSGAVGDVSRIYPDPYSAHNQSVRGLLLRSGFTVDDVGPFWLGAGVLVSAVVFVTAALASRRGEELLALTLVGMCGAALSPWSWGHHWMWVLPLAVVAVARVAVFRAWWVPVAMLPFTFPHVLALADPPDEDAQQPVLSGFPAFVVGNLYVLVFVAAVVVSICHLRSRAARAGHRAHAEDQSWRKSATAVRKAGLLPTIP